MKEDLPYLISLPKIADDRGNLSFFENLNQIPFTIERTYLIYDVPGGEKRGGHAYKTLQEVIIALSGSFEVLIDNGSDKFTFSMNRSYCGLYIPNMTWRHIQNFSTNALALIVSDQKYSKDDYIYNYDEFLSQKHVRE